VAANLQILGEFGDFSLEKNIDMDTKKGFSF
jgi:hypothetical protein